ncbi:dual specificity protein phosphatase family protein [Erwinia sp. V71]|uniref:dual specificity protein phosphatase family protein n=1 Tax=Erwinia sp. V71 TaxID=3369424 RepID=UPI003F61C626
MLLSEDARRQAEKEQDKQAVLLRAAPLPGGERWLWLGNLPAAQDGALLLQSGITSTLNLAVNLHPEALTLGDGTVVRRTQVGLIDGAGNHANHLLAGVLALDGMVHQDSPGKPSYPLHRRGDILVHCRGGRSRSVSVLALYLYYTQPEWYPTVQAALAYLRQLRGIDETHPCQPLITLVYQLAEMPLQGLFR